ncbi:Metallothionein-like protein [Vigna angularis]|uniref:Metallothionein-like protein n=1 Tax=Phaseolus angularis TaxID=3914 RepID=A0A8T0KYW3_PHAAN|nr:Metallothionein-like protein [Vigna angularis]
MTDSSEPRPTAKATTSPWPPVSLASASLSCSHTFSILYFALLCVRVFLSLSARLQVKGKRVGVETARNGVVSDEGADGGRKKGENREIVGVKTEENRVVMRIQRGVSSLHFRTHEKTPQNSNSKTSDDDMSKTTSTCVEIRRGLEMLKCLAAVVTVDAEAPASAAVAAEGDCKMYPDLSYTEQTTTETLVMGVAPVKVQFEGAEMGVAGENDGCKCGSNCTCNPCTCK